MFSSIASFFTGGSGTLLSVLGLLVVVSGLVGYHFYTVEHLDAQLLQAEAKATALAADNAKLSVSNTSLEAAIAQKDQIQKDMLKELSNIRNKDAVLQKQLAEQQKNLESVAHNAKLDKIRSNDKGAKHLLDVINNNVACQTAHFGEDGVCSDGTWKPSAAPATTK